MGAQRKTANLPQAKGRKHEKLNEKNLEENKEGKIRTEMLNSKLTGRDMHAQGKSEGAELMGFGFQDDDYERDFRQRGPNTGRGGRRGKGKAVFDAANEDDFPAL